MKKIIISAIIILSVLPLWSQNILISQVDTNNLLFKGKIDIYFSMTGIETAGLSPEDFTIREETMGDLEITALKKGADKDAGIDFILLIDNSGSMYEESYQGSRRIAQAKLALSSFLENIDESRDRVGVYAFNTMLEEIAPLGTKVPDIHRRLSAIEQPEAGMAYTELYNSLGEVARLFPGKAGRRAVIVLSDGENYSLFQHGGREHEEWGKTVISPEEIVQTYQETGITLDGINISDKVDTRLAGICGESGGSFHDVRSTDAISNVYTDIKQRITDEYMITVKAPPLPGSRGRIKLSYKDGHDSRDLLVPVLFGGASDLSIIVSILLLLFGLAGLGAVYYIPFEKPVKSAQIQSLESNQRTILNEGATIIGASRDADYTIAGNPGIDSEHATIVHDKQAGTFTLVSNRAVRVNNRKVKNRELTPGDVIQIEGSTIIFDAPDATKV
ncbi:MAG: VWA domain-containing protein [Spirochaetales bacterium]|nr:VWA domain-containing protein [Spirochaetales bacterium]